MSRVTSVNIVDLLAIEMVVVCLRYTLSAKGIRSVVVSAAETLWTDYFTSCVIVLINRDEVINVHRFAKIYLECFTHVYIEATRKVISRLHKVSTRHWWRFKESLLICIQWRMYSSLIHYRHPVCTERCLILPEDVYSGYIYRFITTTGYVHEIYV